MTGLIGSSPAVFLGLTVALFGLAAFTSGQAIADDWRPSHQAFLAAAGLTVADRFLAGALFGSPPLSLPAAVIAWLYLSAVAWVAWRMTLARKMVRQYPWLYRPSGLMGWRRNDAP